MAAGSGARLLAEKIENDLQLRIAVSEGCTLFQGYFFSQPSFSPLTPFRRTTSSISGCWPSCTAIPSNLRKIEKLISGDASLCYRILRVANSALQGHPGMVSSIREALLMIGEDSLRRMVTVAMAGALPKPSRRAALHGSGPRPLLRTARARALRRAGGTLPSRSALPARRALRNAPCPHPRNRSPDPGDEIGADGR